MSEIICDCCGSIDIVSAKEIETVVFFPMRYVLLDGTRWKCPSCGSDDGIKLGSNYFGTSFLPVEGNIAQFTKNAERNNILYSQNNRKIT